MTGTRRPPGIGALLAGSGLALALATAPASAQDPPSGFRHVTVGYEPSTNTPESNHRAEGLDASSRVEDFFEEGRPVPHREGEPPFGHRHLTRGPHASQFAPRDRHVAEGAGASTLEDAAPSPGEGERHLTRGPGASSNVPAERHVAEGPEASGLVPAFPDPGPEPVEAPTDYNPDAVRDAPAAPGTQRMVVEIHSAETDDVRTVPGGGDRPRLGSTGEPAVWFVSLGRTTGEAFRIYVTDGSPGDVRLRGPAVLEPVALKTGERRAVDRTLGRAGAPTLADGYCLEYLRRAPPEGMVFRLAPPADQARLAPVRRVLEASLRLRDAGALRPDSDPEEYFHSVRQWAIWTLEQGFGEASFADAFVERVRENYRTAGREWTPSVEAAVRTVATRRWGDVRRILETAEGT